MEEKKSITRPKSGRLRHATVPGHWSQNVGGRLSALPSRLRRQCGFVVELFYNKLQDFVECCGLVVSVDLLYTKSQHANNLHSTDNGG